ncbi:MAG: ribosomal RNA small subunit methyltransferase A [Clostridiales bacterium]|nr:ribosomal RNA small subunit methyltransferase A [Clostridiales bacterium]
MNIKNVLKEKNFTFKKSLGQNFLTDEVLLGGVVEKAGVTNDVSVLEIGVGAGTLTSEIAKRAKKVLGFEVDKNLKPVLDKTLSEFSNVTIDFRDVMKVSMQEIEELAGEEYMLVANLPYYITTPIIMRFIEDAKNCKAIVVTIQKEVAERIVAKEKTSDYGSITVSINAVADTEIIEYIGREKFYPSPNVDSAVVKITLNPDKYYIKDIVKFRNLIKNSFLMRRKTLVNNLMKGYNLSRLDAEELLNKLKVPLNARGEELSVKEFIDLAELI